MLPENVGVGVEETASWFGVARLGRGIFLTLDVVEMQRLEVVVMGRGNGGCLTTFLSDCCCVVLCVSRVNTWLSSGGS